LSTSRVFIGIDVGTQGSRVMALSHKGMLLSVHTRKFSFPNYRMEQDPEVWWSSVLDCLQRCAKDLKSQNLLSDVHAVLVTSTSGTVIALDRHHEPVSPAIMYSDSRSALEAEQCRNAAALADHNGFKDYNASSGLPKILWYMHQHEEAGTRIAQWVHASDYITGKLSGVWGITDYSNSLKTGYDMQQEQWPDYITSKLGIPAEWLPKVAASGTAIGTLTKAVSEQTGLPAEVLVCVGMTDGCVSQIASGAVSPGDWNTTIGTTMVIKGVTTRPIVDPLGRLYNHKHPDGYWMPGGASNTGSDWVAEFSANMDLDQLTRDAEKIVPTPWLTYPLRCQGERFPFIAPQAEGFESAGMDAAARFASSMEGVAYIERLSFDTVREISGESIQRVFTAGGASNNALWLNIRSCVLNLPIIKVKHTEGAAGAAVLAASKTHFGSLREAAEEMIQVESLIEPRSAEWIEKYNENYERFVDKLKESGYLH